MFKKKLIRIDKVIHKQNKEGKEEEGMQREYSTNL